MLNASLEHAWIPQEFPKRSVSLVARAGVDNMAVKRRNRYYPRVRRFPPFDNRTTNTIVKGATTIATLGVLGAMTTGVVGALTQK